MNSKQALKNICENCENHMLKAHTHCPFRSISSDYCGEYEIIKKDLDLLNKIIESIKSQSYNPVTKDFYWYDLELGYHYDKFELDNPAHKRDKEIIDEIKRRIK